MNGNIHDFFKYIYEEILTLHYNFEKLLDYLENDDSKPYQVAKNMGVTNVKKKGTAKVEQEQIPRALPNPSARAPTIQNEENEENQTADPIPGAPNIQNEENKENQTPDPKSDLKNCLTYVKNQCGKHTLNEMAEMLNIGRATFFRKIKGQNIELQNKGNKECEFCLRKKAKISDNDNMLTSVITNDMKEYIRNACNGHKGAEMARLLEVKPHTLRAYLLRNKIQFSNKDPTTCYF